jgi:hypothetical protein
MPGPGAGSKSSSGSQRIEPGQDASSRPDLDHLGFDATEAKFRVDDRMPHGLPLAQHPYATTGCLPAERYAHRTARSPRAGSRAKMGSDLPTRFPRSTASRARCALLGALVRASGAIIEFRSYAAAPAYGVFGDQISTAPASTRAGSSFSARKASAIACCSDSPSRVTGPIL